MSLSWILFFKGTDVSGSPCNIGSPGSIPAGLLCLNQFVWVDCRGWKYPRRSPDPLPRTSWKISNNRQRVKSLISSAYPAPLNPLIALPPIATGEDRERHAEAFPIDTLINSISDNRSFPLLDFPFSRYIRGNSFPLRRNCAIFHVKHLPGCRTN